MAVCVQLDRPHAHFTNLDFITGKVLLRLSANESVSSIVVKLEGESKTRLGSDYVPGGYGQHDRYARDRAELEIHKLLYKTALVFPLRELSGPVSGGQSYTLAAGQYEYPFQFKIPFNNDCSNQNSKLTNLNVAGLRVEMARDTNRHVKKTLPPTLTGFAGQAEIRYYVKVTVQRPAFYKENYRAETDFKFLPIEPPRPESNSRESYARRQHQFAPSIDIPDKPGLFRKASTPTSKRDSVLPPSISFDARLPDPAIVTCNEPLPLRVLITKLNDSPATIFLQLLEVVLVGTTLTRAHELQREDIGNFIVMSLSNLNVRLQGSERNPNELAIDPKFWNQVPLPNTVAPSFIACNLSRRYRLDVKVGLTWGSGTKINPELMVQTVSMPVEVYSGIRPPQALLNAMSHPNHPQAPPLFQSTPQTPTASNGPPAPFAPPPSDIPVEAPPSYEDAIADDLRPIDGPRREYTQPPQAQQSNPIFGTSLPNPPHSTISSYLCFENSIVEYTEDKLLWNANMECRTSEHFQVLSDERHSFIFPVCVVFDDQHRGSVVPHSQSRARGPMYTEAIYQKLLRVEGTNELIEEIDDEEILGENCWDILSERAKAIEEFKQAVHKSLRNIERQQIFSGQQNGIVDRNIVRIVSHLAWYYLDSFPNRENTAADGPLHNHLWRILRRDESLPNDSMERAIQALEFRINQLSTVDRYLEILQIPAPKGQSCADFIIDHRTNTKSPRYLQICSLIFQQDILFPRPMDDQDHDFYKGVDYLVEAFELAEIPNHIIKQKLNALVAVVDPELEELKAQIENEPEIVSKRKRVYDAYGLRRLPP